MEKMSFSFTCGRGSIEHNLRKLKGRGIRQNGIIERRGWNEIIVNIDPVKAIQKEVKPLLDKYNKGLIAKGRTNRVKTFKQWLKSVQYSRNGKQRSLYSEIIVQFGDRFNGCPYEIERDKNGNMLDLNGKIIKDWDTRKTPAPKNGIYTKSKQREKLIKVYKRVVEKLQELQKNAIITTAVVHCDEYGGCHLHINLIFKNKRKDSIGIGFSKSKALEDYLDGLGIPYKSKSRKENAVKIWTDLWREKYLPEIAKEFNIEREIKNESGRKHLTVEQYKQFDTERKNIIEKEIKEEKRVYEEKKAKAEKEIKEALQIKAEAERKLKEAKDLSNKTEENLRKMETIVKQLNKQQEETEKRWKMAQEIIDISTDGVKKYIVNHYKVLQENPELWEIIHKEVVERNKNKSIDTGKNKRYNNNIRVITNK